MRSNRLLPLIATLAACTGTTTPKPVIVVEELDTAFEVVETSDVVDSDSDAPAETDDTDGPIVGPDYDCDDAEELGLQYVCDFSVNVASLVIPTGGGDPLAMRTEQSAPTPPGSYHGAGYGNRAIAGFSGYDRLPLASLTQISFDAEHIVGPIVPPMVIAPEINLIVDLTCGRGPDHLISVIFANLGEPEDQGLDRFRYTVLPGQEKWTANGGIDHPDGSGEVLLPDPYLLDADPPAPLSDLLGVYPDACLRNDDFEDAHLPVDADTSGILLTLGTSATLVKSEWQIWRVQINDDVHLPPE